MHRRIPLSLLSSAILLAVTAGTAGAAKVSGLGAFLSGGQTFLTWTSPAGAGWAYRIYRRTGTPPPGAGPSQYQLAGTVGDSTWCDRRLSQILGVTYAFVVPGTGALNVTRGLFVFTCGISANTSYAVTCEKSGVPADTTFVAGTNATASPVSEFAATPAPVYQRTLSVFDGVAMVTGDVYTLWTSDQDTPFARAMCDRPSTPYDCAIVVNAGGSTHALVFTPHVRDGNFLGWTPGTYTPGEYILYVDDWVENSDVNTFYFGYHDGYDIQGSNLPPGSGIVRDYTMRRVVHTIQWACHQFPIDTTRVYVNGASMGAICGAELAFQHPDLVAGMTLVIPLFDFSFESDFDPTVQFGVGGFQRKTCDNLWGAVSTDLVMENGTPVFDVLNGNWQATAHVGSYISPMVAYSGRHDTVIGWGEKPPFYRSMRQQRAGGCFFFDDRVHGDNANAAWNGVFPLDYFYRYRRNLSFPAFSNCSFDDDPGDGHETSGDSVGTINGHLDWDPELYDAPTVWSVHLKLQDLQGRFQLFRAPESLFVDVTPRRTQQFHVAPFARVDFDSWGLTGPKTSGSVYADQWGIVTVPHVKVYRAGIFLTLRSGGTVAVDPRASEGFSIAGLPTPLRSACEFEVQWPGSGAGRVDLLDLQGRRVRQLLSTGGGAVSRVRLALDGVPAGMYFVRAEQEGRSLTRRVAVTR